MRIPKPPPDINNTLPKIIPSDKQKRMLSLKGVDEQGRYLPWDEFRRHTPPEGLTAEEAWVGMRVARAISSIRTPFLDKNGRPFTFNEPDSIRRGLHEIDSMARGQIQVGEPVLNRETQQTYLVRSLIEEPFNSSLIEGAATTREIAKAMVREGRAPQTKSERMVLNNYRTMEFIKTVKDEPLSIELIHEIHRQVTDGTLDKADQSGRFRRADERINVVDQFEEILHEPPGAHVLPERVQRICDFANRDPKVGVFMSPVIKAIILHFMTGYDHPYVDGNGRTARALFYWSVIRDGYWLLEYVSISRIIAQSTARYGRAYLYTESDQGDLTYFIEYHIEIILRAIGDLVEYLKEKMADTNRLELALKGSSLEGVFNARQLDLLKHAIRHPGAALTIRQHMTLSKVSYQTARNDLELMVDKGLFGKKTGRETIYVAPKNLLKKLK